MACRSYFFFAAFLAGAFFAGAFFGAAFLTAAFGIWRLLLTPGLFGSTDPGSSTSPFYLGREDLSPTRLVSVCLQASPLPRICGLGPRY
jgi:hypothetical protein